jgi:hypothetical protein
VLTSAAVLVSLSIKPIIVHTVVHNAICIGEAGVAIWAFGSTPHPLTPFNIKLINELNYNYVSRPQENVS